MNNSRLVLFALVAAVSAPAFAHDGDPQRLPRQPAHPGNPVIVGQIPGPQSLWRDMRVFSHYCYPVSEGGSGIQVTDLAQIDNGVVTLVNTVTTGGVLSTHTVALNTASGTLYRAGG